MKVVCNLHPLGIVAHGSAKRTGVFRVVEHLAQGLAASTDCETSFHATDHLWQSWDYYQKYLRNSHTRFAWTSWQKFSARALSLAGLEKFVATTVQHRALPLRVARRLSVEYTSRMSPAVSSLPSQFASSSDIYHSPFVPIPPSVKRCRRLRRFTTIYDLLAVSHPHFFGSSVTHLIRNLLTGLNEEDHALCISEATRQALLEHAPQLDPARVFVTPLAAGPAFYPEHDPEKLAALRRKIALPPGVPYFLSLCTLETRKNLETTIRAFARLRRERQLNVETRLVLVGNMGWKTEKMLAALEEAKDYQDHILITGFVPDEDLAALYSGATAFVYMSYLEGFGLPPLEAMQCGVPAITSNTSSLPEVVGDAGIMLAPDDLDGLATAMLSLASDEARRADLAARARAHAALFSWERFVRQNLDAYRHVLAA